MYLKNLDKIINIITMIHTLHTTKKNRESSKKVTKPYPIKMTKNQQ